MGMTFFQTYECEECGYVFEGLSGIQDHGGMFNMHSISPMLCSKCGNIKNIVSGADIEDTSICENCGMKMKNMEENVVYECPKCHKKTLKCVNTDSVYSKNKIYLY